MPDFSSRSQQIEVMDDLQCSGEVVNQTLRELEFINHWLGGNQVTISGLNKLLKNHDRSQEITIADLGCGSGDMLRLIDRWARERKFNVTLIGIDANSHIIEFAKTNSTDFPQIQFRALDIFSSEFQSMKFDIVIGTLFYHHFTIDQLKSFFDRLKKQAKLGLVINDIHRHPLAYYSIKFLTGLFSKSSMVKYDAPLSVLRAFTKQEIVEILKGASLKNFTIHWKWAFRWQVVVVIR
jgi:2-polyprenyl-3-methyl-5-hydroxy-6-metoxy-1,4-benzoquinol methylase